MDLYLITQPVNNLTSKRLKRKCTVQNARVQLQNSSHYGIMQCTVFPTCIAESRVAIRKRAGREAVKRQE